MITPTLRQLDIFAQMIASGSIADCAHDLGLSATVVERELDALEQRLGHRLFVLRSGMAQLTPAGRKTVEAMQTLSEMLPERWADAPPPPPAPPPPVVQADAPARQQVTIAAHPAIFGHFQDALSAFEQANGDVTIALDLDTHTAAQAIPMLATGRADIAYFYTLGEPKGMTSRYAWSEPMSLYIGDMHPIAAQETVTIAMLAEIQPIMLLPGNSLRPIIDRALGMAGISVASPVAETDNLFDIMTAVRDGQGYFAAFGPLARDFGRMSGIRRLPLSSPLPSVEVRQAVRAAVRDDSVISALAEYLFR